MRHPERAAFAIAPHVHNAVVDSIANDDGSEKAGGSVEAAKSKRRGAERHAATRPHRHTNVDERPGRAEEQHDHAQDERNGDDAHQRHVLDERFPLCDSVGNVTSKADLGLGMKVLRVHLRGELAHPFEQIIAPELAHAGGWRPQ